MNRAFHWITAILLGVVSLAVAADSVEAARWRPSQRTSWQIQFTGTFKTVPGVEVYELDLFGTTSSRIERLHNGGSLVICYFSAGSWEDWRPDKSKVPKSMIGNSYNGWPGEWWLDIRKSTVRELMKDRLVLAREKGCDAVDPDNMDSWDPIDKTGFGITNEDQLSFNKYLSREARRLGMSIALKNDLPQIPELVAYFDFAVNESCFSDGDCDQLMPFIDAGKAVLQIQYSSADVCDESLSMGFSTIYKKIDLGFYRKACS